MSIEEILGNQIFVAALVSFWFFHILRRTSFWLWFWQLKEYRFDRFFDGIRENKRLIFPKTSFFAPILIALFFTGAFFKFATSVIYIFLGAYSLNCILRRRWSLPKFTKKMILLFTFALALEIFLVVSFLPITPKLFLFLLFLEILFPLYISFCVFLIQIPTFFAKKYILKKAREKRNKFKDLIVIGITGSYGKSSTKEFLYQLLLKKYEGKEDRILKTEGNQNTEMGVANTILKRINKDHEIFICEMAAYRKGEIKTICDVAKPQMGILTGISEQHIALFGSLQEIMNTKYELINSLPKDGAAIFNASNKECQKLAQRTSIKKYFYSSGGDFDLVAKNIKEKKDFIEFDVSFKDKLERIRLNLIGGGSVENFLGAMICALNLGMTLPQIKKAASQIRPSATAIKKEIGKNGVSIINDAYSQNPDGVIAAIDHLENHPGKKVIIMPCLIELGKSASSVHKNIGRKIGQICDFAIITNDYYFDDLKLGAKEGGIKEENIISCQGSKNILETVEPFIKKDNVILLEGRMSENIINNLIAKER